jgi:hypothetical protein
MNRLSLGTLGILWTVSILVSASPSQAATMESQLTVLTLPGTDIYVDGVYTDHCYGYYLPVVVTYGTHTIKLTKPGYFPFVTTVNVTTKISSVFADNLIPISTTNFLKAADDWSNNRITTQELLAMADVWSG